MIVLHYIQSLDSCFGGTAFYMQLLSAELGKLCNLHVLTHSSKDALPLENAHVHYITKPINFVSFYKQVVRLIDEIIPDVININGCWYPGCSFVSFIAKRRGIKVVLTPHGMLEPWIMKRHYYTRKLPALLLYQKSAIMKADIIHATAESEKKNIAHLGYNSNVKVIPNGIKINDIQQKQSWKRTKKILFLSRVHPKKGLLNLLDSVAQLKSLFDGYKVLIAGEGDLQYIKELKNKITELKIGNIVSIVGAVYGNEKWKLYRESDLFVLPTFSENFGIVIAEALASGTPVITTKGTPWEDLERIGCGWWVDVGLEPLVKALKMFFDCPETKLEEMGKKGRKLVEAKYSSFQMAESLMKLYESIL